MFRIITITVLVVTVFTIVGILIPDRFIDAIDSAIIYFLSYINNLDGLFNVSTLFTCFLILANFYVGVVTFWTFHWLLKLWNS
jgi:hypothetical protein